MMQMMMASQSMGQQSNSPQEGGSSAGGDTDRQAGDSPGQTKETPPNLELFQGEWSGIQSTCRIQKIL